MRWWWRWNTRVLYKFVTLSHAQAQRNLLSLQKFRFAKPQLWKKKNKRILEWKEQQTYQFSQLNSRVAKHWMTMDLTQNYGPSEGNLICVSHQITLRQISSYFQYKIIDLSKPKCFIFLRVFFSPSFPKKDSRTRMDIIVCMSGRPQHQPHLDKRQKFIRIISRMSVCLFSFVFQQLLIQISENSLNAIFFPSLSTLSFTVSHVVVGRKGERKKGR
jgi:hypothetical protein